MRQVDLDEIYNLALDAKEEIWAKAESLGRTPCLYLHWSAARYDQKFEDYHINIDGSGRCWASTDDFSETLAHTWKRNTGAIGISLCCCYEATTNDLGEFPPTPAQIESMAQVVAVVADALWLTIDKYHVLTHGEAADNEDGNYIHEPYGPKADCQRWDLEYLGTEESPSFNPYAEDGSRGGDVLRGKALWYKNKGI